MKHFARSSVVVALATLTLAGCGGSSSSAKHPNTCKANQFIGNSHSHVLHRPGAHVLPSAKRQVCFDTLAAAKNAGYHLRGH